MSGDAVLSRPRIVFLAVSVASAYTVWGLLISLQPPFYPQEAENKGAKPSQYGFVFGIANLAAFLSAPIFGRFGNVIGPKFLYNSGAFVQAFCGLAFGFLTFVDSTAAFLGLSYTLRALGGIADVAAWSAAVSILMKLFPSKVAQVMSLSQMFFGVGYMIGPALGSFLYKLGGFILPFLVVGSIGLVVAVSLIFAIPNVKSEENTESSGPVEKKPSAQATSEKKKIDFVQVLRSPSIWLPFVDNGVCFFGNGLLVAMMQPHLAAAGATLEQVALTYLTFGLVFAVATFISGQICDRINYPSILSVLGNSIMAVCFVFVGPLPFLPMEPDSTQIRVSMGIAAFGYGAVMVSTFSRAQAAAVRKGFSKDLDTYLLISGMWSSSFYFGNFLGPTIAGVLIDAFDFRSASLPYWICYLVIVVVDLAELSYSVKNKLTRKSAEYEELDGKSMSVAK